MLSKYNLLSKKYILGVANVWDKRKGLEDFIRLFYNLKSSVTLVLVGLKKKQIINLPEGMVGIERTENISELVTLYSAAELFLNPTYVDNFPTTNLEALACGTPIITYNTGGSVEATDDSTGMVVEKGNIDGIISSMKIILKKGNNHYQSLCRERAVKYYNIEDRYQDYLNLYLHITSNNKKIN